MNNTIKFLLFNILLCAAPAMQAMRAFKGLGRQLFTSFATAKNGVSFGAQQMSKPVYKITTATAFGIGLAGFVYQDSLSNVIQKNKFRELHCDECLKNMGLEKPTFSEKRHIHDAYARAFERIKKAMNMHEDIVIFPVKGYNGACVMQNFTNCERHKNNRYNIFLDVDFLAKYPKSVRYFALAHELMHIQRDHANASRRYIQGLTDANENSRVRCVTNVSHADSLGMFKNFEDKLDAYNTCNNSYNECFKTISKKSFLESRRYESEADRGAALALGSIEGGMLLFGATPSVSDSSGWKLPADCLHEDPQDVHPSKADRCRALLALVEKHPHKFPKKFEDVINNVNP